MSKSWESGISRRTFLSSAAAATTAYGAITAPAVAAKRRARRPDVTTDVAVLGGGVGGLTAAHELAERGFTVTVFEPKALGGKARSIPVPGTGTGGRRDLPGEHGFRFFPGFYTNVPDTMRRIPVAGNAQGVFSWDYVNAGRFSAEYQKVFGNGLTKDLVAAKGTVASTYTIGLMGLAFIYSVMAESSPPIQQQSGYGNADRLLDAPTDEAWIDPWVAHLRSLGVRFVVGYGADKLHVAGGEIAGVTLRGLDGTSMNAQSRHYVAAMPVEKARVLFDQTVRAAAPELAKLDALQYDYMNGIQFFLNQRLDRPVQGHVAYLDSPWALTSIEQGLFWKADLTTTYGNGSLQDILSVDISDWGTPGILYGKPAVDCTRQQIFDEVWAQLQRALNTNGNRELTDAMLIDWSLDPAITFPAGKPAVSSEPLLINTVGSLANRPDSTTSIPNLFLAADYVRCNVDLATMEGANEAGRQAANAILDRSGSRAAPASIGTLWEPPTVELGQAGGRRPLRRRPTQPARHPPVGASALRSS